MQGDTLMQVVVRTLDRISLSGDTYRIIPSNYPTIALFESCLTPEDLQDIYDLESLTNDRLKDEVGDLNRVPIEDRVSGSGTSAIMASFTHLGMSSRFTDGSFGVYYAGLELETAIAETKFWQEKQMRETNEPPFERTMRVYKARIDSSVGDFVDLSNNELVHDPNNYSYSQSKARELRAMGEYGVYYNSIRNLGGNCIAAFRPPIIMPTTQSKHLRYCWDGNQINRVIEVRDLDV